MISKKYAELNAISNFSFLSGASHPEELVERAAELDLYALGIADENSLAGVVRAHLSAKHKKLKLLIGSRLLFLDNTLPMIIYPINLHGYQKLSRLLTKGKMRAAKGACSLFFADLVDISRDVVAIATLDNRPTVELWEHLIALKNNFKASFFYCAVGFLYDGESDEHIGLLDEIEQKANISVVVTNSVIAHDHTRRPLADVLACIKRGVTLDRAGFLRKNSERHLKSADEMWRIFSHRPRWLKNSIEIADRIDFSLDDLSYRYPSFKKEGPARDQEFLANESFKGALRRYGEVPKKINDLLQEELSLVAEMGYATYFLTVYDIIRFAKSRGILCQGRGSAANSVICYCLGITEVDPNTNDLLFGRFISKERNEPPDIDVDFENSRREEVMQYIYQKYGRAHAAIVATVITYKKRMAVREVAKVFGLTLDGVDALMLAIRGLSLQDLARENSVRLIEILNDTGLSDPASLRRIFAMASLMLSFPRHLGQHVGGFVIDQNPLNELVPIGPAAMAGRTFIEWDKDDLDSIGILKIDILALGMLSAIKKTFDLIENHYGKRLDLNIKRDDPNVYHMLSKADTIGVFQVESRAQMSMLPRLKPKKFYDLVIQVAIIRPGPIQGDMVHPYLRRRNGEEKISYPSKSLERILGKTLGVPLFQEQVMQVAMDGAGFTAGEADKLRRSMATFKRLGTVNHFYQRFIDGMMKNGYQQEFAERVFKQFLGFAEYGFPESHAASFANLVYVSAWLKYYYPAAFSCALLNCQPMGFYAPAQLIADVKRHGIVVLPIDINKSAYENTLERVNGKYAIRLGLSEIRGVHRDDMDFIIACRPAKGYSSIPDIHQKSGVSKRTLLRLNKANVFKEAFLLDERQSQWQILGLAENPLPLFANIVEKELGGIDFPKVSEAERVCLDYNYLGYSLLRHPLTFMRASLRKQGFICSSDIPNMDHGSIVSVAGLVIVRQRPATANNVIFFTLEDEAGLMNIVIWPSLAESHRREVMMANIIAIQGRLEKKDGVHHIIASEINDVSNHFARLDSKARSFR